MTQARNTMDDLSMLSFDEDTFRNGDDDDTFLDNPGDNNLTNTTRTNLAMIEEDSVANNLDTPSKMDGTSIIHDLIGAALSLSTRKKEDNSAATTQNNNSTSGKKTSQELQQDEIDEEERRPLGSAALMNDIHELLREQQERILKEAERKIDQQIEQALEREEALHREEIQKLKSQISTPQRPGIASMRSLSIFNPSGGMGFTEGGGGEGNGSSDNQNKGRMLEEDVYSLLMLNAITPQLPISPFWRKMKKYTQRLLIAQGIFIWMNFISDIFTPLKPAWIDFNESTRQDEYILYASTIFLFWLTLSSTWFLGMFTFIGFQFFLGMIIIGDQLSGTKEKCEQNRSAEEVCIPFDLPTGMDPILALVQYFTGILVLATQTDILTAILNVILLRNADRVPWDRVVGEEGNRTWKLWITRILLPNVLKFIQAFVVLCASFIIIIQGQKIVDLLKDFTAVLVVSQSDNILFSLANMGYLGRNLAQKTFEVQEVRWCNAPVRRRMRDNVDRGQLRVEMHSAGNAGNAGFFSRLFPVSGTRTGGSCFSYFYRRVKRIDLRVFIFNGLFVMMVGGITFIKLLQMSGTLTKMKYPNCRAPLLKNIGNGYCNDGFPMNTAKCGYDGGDCGDGFPKPVRGYPDCFVLHTYAIGDGECWDWPPYNTPECGFDGGDCHRQQGLPVDNYPDCFVSRPEYIGDELCHDFPPYNTLECGFDGGDCERNEVDGYMNCLVHYTDHIGDGYCNNYKPYNTEVCGFDGGDCAKPVPVD